MPRILLEEFDPSPGLIEPTTSIEPLPGFPERVVMNFTHSIIEKWAGMEGSRVIGLLESANGGDPIYALTYRDTPIAFMLARTGAPASAGYLEELAAMGGKKFVVFGSCGALRHDLADGHIVIPDEALRDEGTSFHYQPPSESIRLDGECVRSLCETMDELGYPYVVGKTWTTDAFFRETPDKVARRREQGCLTVEMECSALAAVARFRGVRFAQFLYAADSLASSEWEQRGLHADQGLSRSDLYMQVAFECALRL